MRHVGVGDGLFRSDIYRGDPVAEADARIEADRNRYAAEDLPRIKVVQEPPRPRLVPAGPGEFTTAVGLEPWPAVVFDVNGYYGALGLHWRATKGEIRRAYQHLKGWRSTRLTYIVKQLLNDEIRRGYDATQIGSVWFDQYVADYVRDQALADERKQHGRTLTPDERMADGGDPFDIGGYLNKPFQVVDNDPISGQTGDEHKERWRWGYYLWAVEDYDTAKLSQWQEMLVRAASAEGRVMRLAVGLKGNAGEVEQTMQVGDHTVCFLASNQQPTLGLAEQAIRQLDSKRL